MPQSNCASGPGAGGKYTEGALTAGRRWKGHRRGLFVCVYGVHKVGVLLRIAYSRQLRTAEDAAAQAAHNTSAGADAEYGVSPVVGRARAAPCRVLLPRKRRDVGDPPGCRRPAGGLPSLA